MRTCDLILTGFIHSGFCGYLNRLTHIPSASLFIWPLILFDYILLPTWSFPLWIGEFWFFSFSFGSEILASLPALFHSRPAAWPPAESASHTRASVSRLSPRAPARCLRAHAQRAGPPRSRRGRPFCTRPGWRRRAQRLTHFLPFSLGSGDTAWPIIITPPFSSYCYNKFHRHWWCYHLSKGL